MLRLVLLLNFIYALASVTHLVLQNNDIYTKVVLTSSLYLEFAYIRIILIYHNSHFGRNLLLHYCRDMRFVNILHTF